MKNSFTNYFADNDQLSSAKDTMVNVYGRLPFLSPQSRAIQHYATSKARVLDAGCGEGRTLAMAKMINPEVLLYGIDLQDYLGGERTRSGVDFKLCNLDKDNIPYPDDYFDFINCSHVLEHLISPINAMNEFMRVLRPGGVVYIETPHTRWTSLPRVPFLTSDKGVYSFWDDPTHVRPHTRNSLRLACEMAGLECIRTGHARKWGHMGALPLAIFSRRNDYKVAVLQALFGLWCYSLGTKPNRVRSDGDNKMAG